AMGGELFRTAPPATCRKTTSKTLPINNESTAKPHRRRIEVATNVHPTSLTDRDNHGRWATMSDSEDTPKGVRTRHALHASLSSRLRPRPPLLQRTPRTALLDRASLRSHRRRRSR